MEKRLKTKIFRICLAIVGIVGIIFAIGMIILRYQVEGEENLPFNISKITIISTAEGIDQEGEHRWNFKLNQNNDIYIYIEKNQDYNKIEVIDSIILDNFQINKKHELGEKNIYRPKNTGTSMLKNKEEYKTSNVEYKGDLETDIRNLKISNQGGIIVFRYANDNIGIYTSDTDEEIQHNQLLKKSNISLEDIQAQISFDITIKLNSGKCFKANVNLSTPSGNIVEEGSSNIEITNLENIIFKRIEN